MERVFNWTPWESASRLPPGDKTFSRFKKGHFPIRKKKSNIRFLRELALYARRVDAELDPGGSGKELVGKGSGTVRARLAWVEFY